MIALWLRFHRIEGVAASPMAKKKNVRIHDVAQAAGVSNATASYALSGKKPVSEATRAKVFNAARQLEYIPNNAAVRLRTGRSNLFGAIINDVTNPFFAEVIAEFEMTVWSAGFLSIVATSQDDPERQAHLIRSMISQGVAGLIISPAQGTDASALLPLHGKSLPFIVCVRDVGDSVHGFVGFDDFAAGQLAGAHVFRKGHKRIAFIGGFENTATWQRRFQGLRAAAAEWGVRETQITIVNGEEGSEFGRRSVRHLLEQKNPPTAVIGFNDITANGAYLAASEMNRRIGIDLSVIGIDNIPQSNVLVPAMTTVELYPRRVGKVCAEALTNLVRGPGSDLVELRIAPTLIERQSVATIRD